MDIHFQDMHDYVNFSLLSFPSWGFRTSRHLRHSLPRFLWGFPTKHSSIILQVRRWPSASHYLPKHYFLIYGICMQWLPLFGLFLQGNSTYLPKFCNDLRSIYMVYLEHLHKLVLRYTSSVYYTKCIIQSCYIYEPIDINLGKESRGTRSMAN